MFYVQLVSVLASSLPRGRSSVLYLGYIHRESKKQDTKLLPIISPQILTDFQNSFTDRLGDKFATKVNCMYQTPFPDQCCPLMSQYDCSSFVHPIFVAIVSEI